MLTTQSFTVYKGAIPPSCFEAEGRIRARITGIDGVETVDMEIVSITEGTGDTDVVSLSYNKDDTNGVTLTNCQVHAFYCLEDCCSTALVFTGYEATSNLASSTGTNYTYWMGAVPRQIKVDSVKVQLPKATENGTSARVCSVILTNNNAGDQDLATGIVLEAEESGGNISGSAHRVNFDSNFLTGNINAGFAVKVVLRDNSTGTVLTIPGPIQVSFLGRYIP